MTLVTQVKHGMTKWSITPVEGITQFTVRKFSNFTSLLNFIGGGGGGCGGRGLGRNFQKVGFKCMINKKKNSNFAFIVELQERGHWGKAEPLHSSIYTS